MIAAVKTVKLNEINIRNVNCPKLLDGEVLIKVDYCGVCGSDLHAYNHAPSYKFVQTPKILGHELTGKVIDVANAKNIQLLDKQVIVESIQYCGKCSNCTEGKTNICDNFQVFGLHLEGGMSQFTKCNAIFVQEVMFPIDKEILALVEPMAIAVHAVENISNIKKGDRVFVQGAGIIGLFVGIICKELGATVTISGLKVDENTRLAHAKKFEIETVIVEESMKGVKNMDYVFECSGSTRAITSGLDALKKGGTFVWVALYEEDLELPISRVVRNEWAIKASYGCKPKDYQRAQEIIRTYSSQLKTVVNYYPLEHTQHAFKEAMNKEVLKPIIAIQ